MAGTAGKLQKKLQINYTFENFMFCRGNLEAASSAQRHVSKGNGAKRTHLAQTSIPEPPYNKGTTCGTNHCEKNADANKTMPRKMIKKKLFVKI